MVFVGLFYAVVGIVFAWPVEHVRIWRLAAWVVSGAAYAGHIGYERLNRRTPPGAAALHVASAVTLGAFGLAVGAILHSISVGSSPEHRRLLLIALLVWPMITGVPAFVVALVAGKVLRPKTRPLEENHRCRSISPASVTPRKPGRDW